MNLLALVAYVKVAQSTINALNVKLIWVQDGMLEVAIITLGNVIKSIVAIVGLMDAYVADAVDIICQDNGVTHVA